MRAFTRIATATALTAGLTLSGAGGALANTPADEGSRPLGVLGALLGGWFEEDPKPEGGTQEESPSTTLPEETGGSGQESPDTTATAPNEQAPNSAM